MPRPWRSVLAAWALGLPALAQTLNLGAPPEPPPRLERALVAPRQSLEQEIRRTEPGPAAGASSALRRAALALLTRGEEPDALRQPDAAAGALLGLTLARRRAELDAAIAQVRDAGLLESTAATLDAPAITPALVEDALRRLLADVRPRAGLDAGWIPSQEAPIATPAEPLTDLATAAGLDGSALAALAALDSRWQAGQSTRAWGRSLQALRADVADALVILDPRRRIAPPARLQPFREALLDALERVEEPRDRATIARLAGAARLALQLPALRNPGQTRHVLDAILTLDLAAPGLEARLDEASAAIASAARTYNPALERQLIRELRPAFRQDALAARESALPVVRVVPDVLRRPDAMSDPAVLSTLNTHRLRWEQADHLQRLSDLMRDRSQARPEPVVSEACRGLARTLVALQRDAMSPTGRDEAPARRRELVAEALAVLDLPGEEALRRHVSGQAPIEGLERVTGGRARALVDRIDARRAEWLRSVADPGSPPPRNARERLRDLSRLVPLLLDCAAYLASGDRLNDWPAWECSSAAREWLAGDLVARLDALCAEAAGPDAVDLARRLDELEQEHAPALVAGALARAWSARVAPSTDAVDRALAELAGPPADERAWMARRRADLARICLIAEEAAALSSSTDAGHELGRERLASLRRAVQTAARPLLPVRPR